MKCYQEGYPRPQFVREQWEDLNGTWEFAFDDERRGVQERWFENFPAQRAIQVPFTYESPASGIGEETPHEQVWYHRRLSLTLSEHSGQRCRLNFEGSDFLTRLWVNGQFVGSHRGGYTRFSFDITDCLRDGENELTVLVEDGSDMQQPRGKQRWISENFGCWYVQTTGIWKTVWLEWLSPEHIRRVKMTPSLERGALDIEAELACSPVSDGRGATAQALCLETEISYEGELIYQSRQTITETHFMLSADVRCRNRRGFEWTLHTWSPGQPCLYDISFRLYRGGLLLDEVGSYFAMRDIRIDKGNILLNGRPLYQRLILDQGYWRDTHLTPPNEAALREDIDKIQRLGYNGLRKHQKIEDERFLYWCDVKGLLVWSEAPAAYEFSDEALAEFTGEWLEIVRQQYNHPCIITWTPFNESWGIAAVETNRQQQHFTESIYHLTKSIDSMRPVIVNDGWEHTVSDIITLHDYEELGELLYDRYTECKEEILTTELYHCVHKSALANGYRYQGQPIIISEFGGIAFASGRGWGYGNMVEDEEAFLKRFDEIATAIKRLPYVCGYCYTQLTDVQQEVNGLLSMDREFKLEPERIREVNERKVGFWRSC